MVWLKKLDNKYPDFDSAWDRMNNIKGTKPPKFEVSDDAERTIKGTGYKSYEEIVEGYYAMAGHKMKNVPKIARDEDRAYADLKNNAVNMGGPTGKDRMKTTQYHELAHHLESNSPTVRLLANDLRNELSKTNGKIESLKDIYERRGEKESARLTHDSEKAIDVDSFEAYIGKVMRNPAAERTTLDKSTEVTSVAIQYFTSKESAMHLYNQDKRLFYHGLASIIDEDIL